VSTFSDWNGPEAGGGPSKRILEELLAKISSLESEIAGVKSAFNTHATSTEASNEPPHALKTSLTNLKNTVENAGLLFARGTGLTDDGINVQKVSDLIKSEETQERTRIRRWIKTDKITTEKARIGQTGLQGVKITEEGDNEKIENTNLVVKQGLEVEGPVYSGVLNLDGYIDTVKWKKVQATIARVETSDPNYVHLVAIIGEISQDTIDYKTGEPITEWYKPAQLMVKFVDDHDYNILAALVVTENKKRNTLEAAVDATYAATGDRVISLHLYSGSDPSGNARVYIGIDDSTLNPWPFWNPTDNSAAPPAKNNYVVHVSGINVIPLDYDANDPLYSHIPTGTVKLIPASDGSSVGAGTEFSRVFVSDQILVDKVTEYKGTGNNIISSSYNSKTDEGANLITVGNDVRNLEIISKTRPTVLAGGTHKESVAYLSDIASTTLWQRGVAFEALDIAALNIPRVCVRKDAKDNDDATIYSLDRYDPDDPTSAFTLVPGYYIGAPRSSGSDPVEGYVFKNGDVALVRRSGTLEYAADGYYALAWPDEQGPVEVNIDDIHGVDWNKAQKSETSSESVIDGTVVIDALGKPRKWTGNAPKPGGTLFFTKIDENTPGFGYDLPAYALFNKTTGVWSIDTENPFVLPDNPKGVITKQVYQWSGFHSRHNGTKGIEDTAVSAFILWAPFEANDKTMQYSGFTASWTDADIVTTLTRVEGLPIGSIVNWPDAYAGNVPLGFMRCDGGKFDGAAYPELRDLVRTIFGPSVGGMFVRPTQSNSIIKAV
jgi:hypothetical protein